MVDSIKNIIEKIQARFPDFRDKFQEASEKSNEVIFFGSFVYGCENTKSDIDILFIGNGKRRVSKCFDFVWVKPQKVYSNTWLCSELANHVANFGLWYKGEGLWREKIFFCEAAVTRKKQLIYQRLLQLFLKRNKISRQEKIRILEKVILNSYRITYLQDEIANPPTCVTIQRIIENRKYFISNIFSDRLLGNLGKAFFYEIFSDPYIAIEETINSLQKKYLSYSL